MQSIYYRISTSCQVLHLSVVCVISTIFLSHQNVWCPDCENASADQPLVSGWIKIVFYLATFAGRLLVPDVIIRPAVNASVLTWIIRYMDIYILSIPDEGDSRDPSCALNLISTLLLVYTFDIFWSFILIMCCPKLKREFPRSRYLSPCLQIYIYIISTCWKKQNCI
jgi:hypothetical protein